MWAGCGVLGGCVRYLRFMPGSHGLPRSPSPARSRPARVGDRFGSARGRMGGSHWRRRPEAGHVVARDDVDQLPAPRVAVPEQTRRPSIDDDAIAEHDGTAHHHTAHHRTHDHDNRTTHDGTSRHPGDDHHSCALVSTGAPRSRSRETISPRPCAGVVLLRRPHRVARRAPGGAQRHRGADIVGNATESHRDLRGPCHGEQVVSRRRGRARVRPPGRVRSRLRPRQLAQRVAARDLPARGALGRLRPAGVHRHRGALLRASSVRRSATRLGEEVLGRWSAAVTPRPEPHHESAEPGRCPGRDATSARRATSHSEDTNSSSGRSRLRWLQA